MYPRAPASNAALIVSASSAADRPGRVDIEQHEARRTMRRRVADDRIRVDGAGDFAAGRQVRQPLRQRIAVDAGWSDE
jgi:hypothetical protein